MRSLSSTSRSQTRLNSLALSLVLHLTFVRRAKKNLLYCTEYNQPTTEASDENDWQIEIPDGDEIDDIEEACVDEDSPPPKNRQRLSC